MLHVHQLANGLCRKRARGFHTDDGPDSTGAVEEETFERPVKRQRTTSIGIVARAASTHFARTPQPVSGTVLTEQVYKACSKRTAH